VYILINRGLSAAELNATAAHEFMHAIQSAYPSKSCIAAYGWLLDATANWAIDYVYPKMTWSTGMRRSTWIHRTSQSRTGARRSGRGRDYGAYLFFQFLSLTGTPT